MNSDMQMIRDFGEQLKPPADRPPLPLRGRVLDGIVAPPRARLWGATALLGGAVAASLMVMAAGQTMEALRRPRPPVASHSGQTAPSTERLLEMAANRVAGEPDRVVRNDQFIYTESVALLQELRFDGRDAISIRRLMVVRLWRSVDGTRDGLIQARPADKPDAEAEWESQAVPACGQPEVCRLNPVQAVELPTDADRMYAYLYRSAEDEFTVFGVNRHERALNRAGAVLKASQHTPAVQAAVFQAMGRIRGVSVRPGVSDVAGRLGVAVVYSGTGTETELVFDPETYRYLGINRGRQWSSGTERPNLWLSYTLALREAMTFVAVTDRAGQR